MNLSHTGLSRREVIAGASSIILASISYPVLTPAGVRSANASEDELDNQAITERFNEIQLAYAPGDPLTPEDEAFVKQYATSQNRSARGTQTFYMTASTVDAYVVAQGNAYHNGTFSYTYGANAQIANQSGGTPRWMDLTVRCDCFGVGQNGSTTFQGSHSCSASTSYQNSFYASPSDAYQGVTAYWNLTLILTGSSAQGNYFSGTY